MLRESIKEKEQKRKQLIEDFCLDMIQPNLPVSTISKKRKVKELKRDELRLGPELTKLIATYLQWSDISNKSCFEIMKVKQKKANNSSVKTNT